MRVKASSIWDVGKANARVVSIEKKQCATATEDDYLGRCKFEDKRGSLVLVSHLPTAPVLR
jgi:hypothetical protein